MKKNELYEQLFESIDNSGFSKNKIDHSVYEHDPISFCEKELGYNYAPKIKEMFLSIEENSLTLLKSCNSYGKTHGLASAIAWYLRCKKDPKIYMSAAPPIDNLVNILWANLMEIIRKHPNMFQDLQITHLRIGTPINPRLDSGEVDGARWALGLSIPSSGTDAKKVAKFSGKHAENQLMVFDEGDAIDDPCYEGAETCCTGENNRRVIAYNPRAKIGYAYRAERDGLAKVIQMSAFDHPNVSAGEEILPGAVTQGKTVDRINRYCRIMLAEEPKTPGECFKLPDFLVGKTAIHPGGGFYPPLEAGWYLIKEPAFSYMVLGEYPAADSKQLISEAWILRARERWDEYVKINGEVIPRFEKVIAGLDVAEFGPDSNSLCFRAGNFIPRFIRWTGIDTIKTASRAVLECQERNVSICNVDGNGVGAGVAPDMKNKGVPANNLKSQQSPTCKMSELGDFKILRDELFWRVARWLENEEAMLPPNDFLTEELLALRYEIDKGYIRISPKSVVKDLIKRSPDDSDSLSYTHYPDNRVFI